MIDGAFKARLTTTPQLGCFVNFADAGFCEFSARLGFDFVVVDAEHGPMDTAQTENMVRAAQSVGASAIVRTPYNRPEHLRRPLDSGADGVQVPLVNTADDASAAVDAATFPPTGARGAAFLTRAARWGLEPDKLGYFARMDAARTLVVHIETPEAIANLDAILAVDGVDVFFVGPGDLAVSMGYAHAPQDPAVMGAIDGAIRKIVSVGKIAGTLAPTAERARDVIAMGATYILAPLPALIIPAARGYLEAARAK